MDVNVFVSSTCQDMKQDCRAAVLSGIQLADDILKSEQAGRAAAVAMEDWDTNYEPALELCLQKIRIHSTHYVGVLGYLHGFVPKAANGRTRSITEEEWRHALKHRGRSCMAMFVPEVGSPIAQDLEQRAKALQTEAESEAQELFRDQVLREGAAQLFKDVFDLHRWVSRKVHSWGRGGLREAARVPEPAVAPVVPSPHSSQEGLDVTELGRLEQQFMFLKGLQELSSHGGKAARAFFVYGPHGSGHRRLAERLVRLVEASAYTQPRCLEVRAGTLWRDATLAGLLRAVARTIRPDWVPGDVSELAGELSGAIADQDVILQISGLEDYDGDAEAFQDQFWAPLVDDLPDALPHRLICLATVETKKTELHVPATGGEPDGHQHRQARSVILPCLGPFTEEDLRHWLKSWLPPANAESLSDYLMKKTEGVPDTVYEFLDNKALWQR